MDCGYIFPSVAR